MIGKIRKYFRNKGEAKRVKILFDNLMQSLRQYEQHLSIPNVDQTMKLRGLKFYIESLWSRLSIQQRIEIEDFTWMLVIKYQHRNLDNFVRQLP